jgi:hypothetical protein
MVREALDGLGAPYLLLNQRRFSIMGLTLEISSRLPSRAERSAGKFAIAPTLPQPARYPEPMGRGCTGPRCKSGGAYGFEFFKAIPGATHSPLRF